MIEAVRRWTNDVSVRGATGATAATRPKACVQGRAVLDLETVAASRSSSPPSRYPDLIACREPSPRGVRCKSLFEAATDGLRNGRRTIRAAAIAAHSWLDLHGAASVEPMGWTISPTRLRGRAIAFDPVGPSVDPTRTARRRTGRDRRDRPDRADRFHIQAARNERHQARKIAA